ncbi:FAD/NAD(P)-binding domain-containing protein [Hypomontagnella submonticulosa]|nr:FAD/NAD(P)-binding domain-containing protein [Hypomontagnella submonticulosa]
MESLPDKVHNTEDLDLVIVGAGISGINVAYWLQTELPQAKFTILEGRNDIGGTWDLFRYPGVRSDSDLYTYGFSWHPWPYSNPIVEGPLIIEYLKTCISQHGIDNHIKFRHNVISMNWSSKAQRWTVIANNDGLVKEYRARFIVLGTGYYDYSTPRQAIIPGLDSFQGKVINPQFWPEELDYTGKNMVVIGSGATAITLLPSLSDRAAKVTMVQRSPSYIAAVPNNDPSPAWMLPYQRIWYAVCSWLLVLFCAYCPSYARRFFRGKTLSQLPKSLGLDPHFSPRYYPWEQRLCFAPDGDFYKALHGPKASIVTGAIKHVTDHAVEMQDGQIIDADIIVTATGLKVQLGGKIDMRVDGEKMDWKGRAIWNAAMIQDIPNMFFVVGYTKASWTLLADNNAMMLVRLLKTMDNRGARSATPRIPKGSKMEYEPFWPISSTYAREIEPMLPKYGTTGPWRRWANPPADYVFARWGDITDGLSFSV